MANQFVGDGYRDREILAEDLVGCGYFFAGDQDTTEGVVVAVLNRLLLFLEPGGVPKKTMEARERDLYRVVHDIVTCARAEGLVDE